MLHRYHTHSNSSLYRNISATVESDALQICSWDMEKLIMHNE